jgi:peptide-methionine (S)-S-oxide reductase
MKVWLKALLVMGMVLTGGQAMAETLKTATFAGGCFWCMQSEFDHQQGVKKTTVGFTGGHVDNPTYEQVSAGNTGHFEAIQVTYDPAVVSYPRLVDIFWSNIDPMDAAGQFCDKGTQYRSAIFVSDAQERRDAEASKVALGKTLSTKLGKPVEIVTEVLPAVKFWPAEEYHQEYYLKNPLRYAAYRQGCGRDAKLKEIHGQ